MPDETDHHDGAHPDGTRTTIERAARDPTINLALDTIRRDKQALVFVNTKKGAEKVAEEIAKKQKSSKQVHKEVADSILNELSTPTKQCRRLAKAAEKGIAFHHAGLTTNQRQIIEDRFRDGSIRIIACTPTLAAGVDLPAFRTIIRDLRRYTQRGYSYISVLEYLQMAGRAGRPDFETYGEAICISSTEEEKDTILDVFVKGEPEPIYSKLAVEPVLRTYVLSLIATGFVRTHSEIMAFFEETYWAHQFRDMMRLELIIDKILSLLEHWEFLRSTKENNGQEDDFRSADSLDDGDPTFKPTPLGRRVAELYLDPLTAHHLIKGVRRASGMSDIVDFAILQLVCNTLEMRPLLKVRTKEMEDIHEVAARYEDEMLEREPSIYEPEYEDYINSVKTAKCLHEWIDEESEEELLERYAIRPGELKGKIDIADWLLYAASELARLQEFPEVRKALGRIRTRLSYGAREELLGLLRLKGIGRVYARKLFSNNIRDVGILKKTSYRTLAHLLGNRRAAHVKEQLGQGDEVSQETRPVRKRGSGRMGQQSITDF